MRKISLFFVCLVCGSLGLSPASATLVSNTALFGPREIITFDEFDQVPVDFGSSIIGEPPDAPPIQIGGVVGQSVLLNGFVVGTLGARSIDLGANGGWDASSASGSAFLVADNSRFTNSFSFTLAHPVAAVGVFLNYRPDEMFPDLNAGIFVGPVDDTGLADEFHLVTVSTPADSVNAGQFFGIVHAKADITQFVVVAPLVFALDNLTFSSSSIIPQASEALFVTLGIAAICLIRWRRSLKELGARRSCCSSNISS